MLPQKELQPSVIPRQLAIPPFRHPHLPNAALPSSAGTRKLALELPCTFYTVIHMCSSHQLGNAALGGLLLVALRLQAIRQNPPLPLLLVQRRPQRLV